MLSKQNRLSARDVATLFQTARPAGGAFFVARYVPLGTISRFAVVAPKTIAKTAVLRNSLRRKWYGSLGDVLEKTKPKAGIYALILKKEAIPLSPTERLNALEKFLKMHL